MTIASSRSLVGRAVRQQWGLGFAKVESRSTYLPLPHKYNTTRQQRRLHLAQTYQGECDTFGIADEVASRLISSTCMLAMRASLRIAVPAIRASSSDNSDSAGDVFSEHRILRHRRTLNPYPRQLVSTGNRPADRYNRHVGCKIDHAKSVKSRL